METYGYTAGRLWPESVTATYNQTKLLALTMTHSGNGSVATQRLQLPSLTNPAVAALDVTQTYAYDPLDRLSAVVERTTNGTADLWRQDYVYDRWGNLAVKSNSALPPPNNGKTPVSLDGTSAPFSNASNQWTGAGIAYDTTGNQTAVPPGLQGLASLTVAYDAESRPVSVTDPNNGFTTTYIFDGEGRRVRKQTGSSTTDYVWDAQGQLAAEYGAAAAEPGRRYLTQDHLGSTRLVTQTAVSGDKLGRFDYLPFGEEVPASWGGRQAAMGYGTASSLRQRFIGKERDTETGLDYFGARYLSGAQGRFTSPDEPLIDQDEADPQSWNLYTYVRNNPLRFIDPTGQTCQKISDGTPYDDMDGKGCAAVDEANKNKKPDVTVGVGWDQARLIMLAGIGESLTSPQTWGSITRGAMENAYPLSSTIVECAARGFGGNCNSDNNGVLYAAAAKPKFAQAAARVARLWTITRPAATKVIGGRTYMKDAKTATWWSRDTAGHGGSAWKVYEERGGTLEWIADADAHGNFISGKHKSSIGTLLK